jgi:hypothetical protein
VNPPTDSRYLYLGAILVLLLLLELVPPVATTGRLLVIVWLFVAASVIANFGSLRSGSQYLQDWSRHVRAELAALELAGPETRSDFAPDPVRAPDITAGRYFAAVRDYGSPASSDAELRMAGEAERQSADSTLIQALGISAAPGGDVGNGAPPPVEGATGGTARTNGACIRFVPSAPGAALELQVADGGVLIRAEGPGELHLRALATTFPEQPLAALHAGTYALRAPARDQVRWHARLTVGQPLSVCSLAF